MEGLVALGLQKWFKHRKVVDDVSLDVQRGEVVGLLGPNGAGKTTAFYTMSGGERRRLEITRALVTSPQYLLLDEPFTGIDPIAIGDIQEIVARLRERGIGILITDHNVRETLAITDRAYILYDGKILVAGTATEIANNSVAREIYLGERFAL